MGFGATAILDFHGRAIARDGPTDAICFFNIQSALAGLWPSVTGSETAPQGLASQLEANISNVNGNAVSSAASPAAGTTATASASGLSGFFVRGGLLFVGGLIIVVGLWALLAKQGYVPGLKFGKG